MAANKEAIAIILDVGPSMCGAPAGESTSLQTSLDAINMIIQRKMFSESKDEVALILFGTANTANDLADGESYENITVARPLGMVNWELLEYIQNEVQPGNVSADFLDAIVVGMDHIVKGIEGKKGFGSKRVILFSDVGGEFADDQLGDIIGSMKQASVEFNVIGPNLEDDEDEDDEGAKPGPSNGHLKEKTPQQRAGEALLRHIIEEVDGASYSFSEALPALSYFQTRQTRPTPWKCTLDISEDLKIPAAGYIRIKEAKAKTYKTVYAKDESADIQRLRTYHLNDEEETEVDEMDTVQGHRYGNTLVPFSKDDQDAMKYRCEKCFKVLGFTASENVKRHLFMGDNSMVFVPEKGDEVSAVALSAFIQALYETNMVAVIRRNYSAATAPRIGCIAPHIKATHMCLIYNELPFTEDLRQFTFGSLPLTSDAPDAIKKHAPSKDQLAAMDELITTMDLTGGDKDDDEDDESFEALKPKLTFNPHLQRLYQCLQHRALNPDDPLPELSPVIANYLKPPEEVLTKCEEAVEKLTKLFKLEFIKKKEEKTAENVFKDVDADKGPPQKKFKADADLGAGMADLVKAKVTEVGTVNPVEDFKSILADKEKDRFEEACKMMEKRIVKLVMDSFGAQFYGKAMDCLKALREESVKNGEPKMFNTFLRDLKDSLPDKGRKDFWDHVVQNKVSLISKMESEDSNVSKEEADKFLKVAEVKVTQEEPPEEDEDEEDLLAQLE